MCYEQNVESFSSVAIGKKQQQKVVVEGVWCIDFQAMRKVNKDHLVIAWLLEYEGCWEDIAKTWKFLDWLSG